MGFFRNTVRKLDEYALKQINDNFMNLWKKVFGNIEYGDLKNIEKDLDLEKNVQFQGKVSADVLQTENGGVFIHGSNIEAGTLSANSIKAETFVGLDITGANIKTNPDGTRLELQGDKLDLYHATHGHVGSVGMFNGDLWIYSTLGDVHIESAAVGDFPGAFNISPSGVKFNGSNLVTMANLGNATTINIGKTSGFHISIVNEGGQGDGVYVKKGTTVKQILATV